MSASESNTCPKCDCTMTSSGFGTEVQHGATHMVTHGLRHGNPVFLAIGGAMAGARALFPKKFTCPTCGYSVRA